MRTITEQEIFDYRTRPDSYLLVMTGLASCEGCHLFKSIFESVEPVFPEIEFATLITEAANDISPFAPPAMPSIVLFIEGYKMFEHAGGVGSKYQLIDLIKSWVLR